MKSSLLALALITACAFGQPTGPGMKLESIPGQLQAHPIPTEGQWLGELDNIAATASLDEIRQVVPTLVSLTESPDAQVRGDALLVLFAITQREKPGLPENRREADMAAAEALVPYISRLEPRLMDPATPTRRMSLLVLGGLASVRPVPAELIQIALRVLNSPQSTQPIHDTTSKNVNASDPPLGSQMVWILLRAGADYYLDPSTHITEGRDSPEVQQAIIQFLRRSDQIPESISESIRALSQAQAQNPAVNAALLPWLNSSDVKLQKLVLQHIAGITLSPEDFADARTRVRSIAADPNAPPDLRQLASSLLPCWSNDRHHQGICPAL